METKQLADATRSLALKAGNSLLELRAEFDAGKTPAPEKLARVRDLNNKIAGLCYAASVLLDAEEASEFIAESGIGLDIYSERVAAVWQEVVE